MFEGLIDNKDASFKNYYHIEFDKSSSKGIAIILVAYSFQFSLFPTLNSLKDKSTENCMRAVNYSIITSSVVYFAVALLGMFFFGSKV